MENHHQVFPVQRNLIDVTKVLRKQYDFVNFVTKKNAIPIFIIVSKKIGFFSDLIIGYIKETL